MSRPLHLLCIAASQRQGSLNLQLAAAAAAHARAAGVQVTPFDLRALALPVYDGDLEARDGVPASVASLRDALVAADGLVLVTPEYNGFPTPLLVNTFDWLSRLPAADGQPSGLQATAGKPVALLSASPGPLGGLRSMNFVRQYLQMAFGMLVQPQQFALGRAGEAFDDQGALKDARTAGAVHGVVDALCALAGALRAARSG